MSSPDEIIAEHLDQSETTAGKLQSACGDQIREIANCVISSLQSGGTIYFCGNGGSAADAQHLAAELIGKYNRDRSAEPAVALTTDTSVLTAVSNDYGFVHVFERQVRGLVENSDVLIAISTSGTSENVLRAVSAAQEQGATVIGFTGASGGDMPSECDTVLTIPSDHTPFIQEGHIICGHILCEIVELTLAGDES